MRPLIPINSVLGDYAVEFTNSFEQIELLIDSPNTLTFIDQNVQNLYPDLYRPSNISVECIESNKTLDMAGILLQKMVEAGVKSNWQVIIIGGGILQDLAGFCCSVYNRGLSYIYVPTTLLAQADSCVGGKTSINFNGKKNIIGTFFPPKKVIINTEFLKTLSQIEYVSGLGEIYKFHILQNKMSEFDSVFVTNKIEDVVYASLLFKNSILLLDEFDKRERKFLNFGHTFGHALEFTSANAIPHGVAVIIGSVVSCIISEKMGYVVRDMSLIREYAGRMLSEIRLFETWFDYENIIEAVKLDKKNTGKIVDVLIDTQPLLTILEDSGIIQEALKETFELLK